MSSVLNLQRLAPQISPGTIAISSGSCDSSSCNKQQN